MKVRKRKTNRGGRIQGGRRSERENEGERECITGDY